MNSHRLIVVGLVVFALLLIVALAAPLIAPFDPYAQDLAGGLSPPSAAHWLGQDKLGRDAAGHLVERTLASVARALVGEGVTRLIVAGGETSGAVVNGLGVTALEIGPEIYPGVPWTRAVGRDLVRALKSGNFGSTDFFVKAWQRLA